MAVVEPGPSSLRAEAEESARPSAEVERRAAPQHAAPRWLRPALVVLVVLALGLLFRHTGLHELASVASLRRVFTGAGVFGGLGFVAVFVLGVLVQIPGLIFVAAALVVFGPIEGFVVAYVGSVASAVSSLATLRALGGSPLASLEHPRLRRAFGQLEQHPVRTVAFLRTIMVLSPPLNLALAFSAVRPGAHLLGSALGLVLPNLVVAASLETLLRWFGGTLL